MGSYLKLLKRKLWVPSTIEVFMAKRYYSLQAWKYSYFFVLFLLFCPLPTFFLLFPKKFLLFLLFCCQMPKRWLVSGKAEIAPDNSIYPRAGGRLGPQTPALTIFLIYFHHNTIKKNPSCFIFIAVFSEHHLALFLSKDTYNLEPGLCWIIPTLFLLFIIRFLLFSYFFLENIPTFFLLVHQRPLSSLYRYQ